MTKILFVCHGNICRSPMAEFVLRDMLKRRGISHRYTVASAATSTEEIPNGVGNPVYPPAKRELLRHGISCEGKRATLLQREDLARYDLLVAMDERNLHNIARIVGLDTAGKVCKLLSFVGETGDVADPWYTGDFERTYYDIHRGCAALLAYLESETEETK